MGKPLSRKDADVTTEILDNGVEPFSRKAGSCRFGYDQNMPPGIRFEDFLRFSDTHLEFGPDFYIEDVELYNAYRNWCDAQCLDQMSNRSVGWAIRYAGQLNGGIRKQIAYAGVRLRRKDEEADGEEEAD